MGTLWANIEDPTCFSYSSRILVSTSFFFVARAVASM